MAIYGGEGGEAKKHIFEILWCPRCAHSPITRTYDVFRAWGMPWGTLSQSLSTNGYLCIPLLEPHPPLRAPPIWWAVTRGLQNSFPIIATHSLIQIIVKKIICYPTASKEKKWPWGMEYGGKRVHNTWSSGHTTRRRGRRAHVWWKSTRENTLLVSLEGKFWEVSFLGVSNGPSPPLGIQGSMCCTIEP